MTRNLFRLVVVSAFVALATAASASAQDFNKNYPLRAGGRISIGTVSGNVTVTGYNGSDVIVTAYKEGRDTDMVDIEDRSSGNSVDVKVRYPKNCHDCNVSVRFEVQVPRSSDYDFDGISSVSGEVKVSNITGRLKASSVSGEVRIEDVSGVVSASSVSGSVDVEINRLDGDDDMKFSSVSGDVNVKVPASLGADIEMSTLSGSLDTDFPIEVKEKKYGPGRSASGRVGEGSRRVRMSSVSGSLRLKYSTRG